MMAMHVDETGGKRQPMLISHGFTTARLKVFPDFLNAVALDPHVSYERLLSPAVEDENVFD
jgi:hypothetical protein